MEMRYTFDSNTVIDFVANNIPDKSINALENILRDGLNVSIIVKIEVLGFDGNDFEMNNLKNFFSFAKYYHLENEVVEQTIALRKKHKKLKLGDAIIAATAMVHNFTLLTRNIKDFQNIEGLLCLNPHEMV